MLKIFTTQLSGVFKKIEEQEDEAIEDCSRLLAQTITGNGTIHIKGIGELEGIPSAIMDSNESIPACAPYGESVVESGDCILAFANNTRNIELEKLITQAESEGISVVSVAAVEKGDEPIPNEEFHIDTKLSMPLVPGEDGERIGYPVFMLALFVFYALYFNTNEMLTEYDREF
ncbi:DUF2529 domain-containing protein [Bacillus sp. Marseille-Q3570]|uniref:DUF2529 domain-containing protein n=1 Tax=Bacillus sp. Marseille-Q3570 TaxID=2963522 RepID=UPI0021B7CC47|nr:DUF2529 domain-containing protein [Bacillus sp. Marseille-Q3570]